MERRRQRVRTRKGCGGWANLALAFFSCLLFIPTTSAQTDATVSEQQIRERLNKILYWSVSDELKLNPKQERDMISILESVQARRDKAFREREASLSELRKMGKAPKDSAVDPLLKRYQSSLEEIAKLEADEYRQLLALWGAPTLARFYIIRDDVAQKVRDALKTTPANSAKK